MPILFLLFVVVPVVEIYLLVKIGGLVGTWPTIGLVVGTGLLGAWLSRQQGRRAALQWQQAMAKGTLPEEGVLSGLLILVGSVLLVTPGVATDVLGLLLLVPPTRRWLAGRIRRRLEKNFAEASIGASTSGGFPFPDEEKPTPSGEPRRVKGRVIDVAEDDES